MGLFRSILKRPKSRLLNLGAGFYYHPEGMTGITNGLINNYNIFLAALDVFLDIPLSNKGALTSYLGYFYYNFGPDFLKSAGMMNVAQTGSGSGLPQGIGNSQWEIGTGQIFRWEAGYLLPGKLLNSGIQPFMGISRKDFEALDQPSFQYDLGLNILRLGHNIKWTAQYSTRPVYFEVNGSTEITEYKGQLLVQTQIFF